MVNVASSKSYPQKLIVEALQELVLGLLLFNIYINDLFLFNISSDICNFADDNTNYACRNDIH